jgi:hypothetical protein
MMTALQGQYEPPPNCVPSRSTCDGKPSHTSIVASANMTSSRCQLQPVLTCVPETMRPSGMRARLPACAARAAASCSGDVNNTPNVSFTTRNVTTASDEGTDGAPWHATRDNVRARGPSIPTVSFMTILVLAALVPNRIMQIVQDLVGGVESDKADERVVEIQNGPIAFAFRMINWRRVSSRDTAPANAKPRSGLSSAKIAASIAPLQGR